MARVKRAVNAQKKRRVTLERASGYRGQRSRLYRKAKEQVTHSLVYAYRDRRAKKGEFRRLWIQRINAGARANGMTYNRFIQGLREAGVEVDRKILADLAVNDAPAFTALVEVAKANLPADVNAPAGSSAPAAAAPAAVRNRSSSRSAAVGVMNSSRTVKVPAANASAVACGPSTRNASAAARCLRCRSLRAAATRAFCAEVITPRSPWPVRPPTPPTSRGRPRERPPRAR